MPHDLEANERNAIAFLRTAYLGEPAKAVEQFVGDEYVTMDFFRLDDRGRIIEHWDTIQQVPTESKNDNSMH